MILGPTTSCQCGGTTQHSSQGNQWRRASAVEAGEIVVKELPHPEYLVNPQVTRDPIAELQK